MSKTREEDSNMPSRNIQKKVAKKTCNMSTIAENQKAMAERIDVVESGCRYSYGKISELEKAIKVEAAERSERNMYWLIMLPIASVILLTAYLLMKYSY